MKQRVLTAITALLVLVPLIIYGHWPFTLFAYLFAIITLYELIRMYKLEKGIIFIVISSIFLCLFMYEAHATLPSFEWLTRFDMMILFMVLLLIITVISKNRFTFDHASFLFMATMFVSTSFSLLVETRMMGLNYLLFLLFVIWATDSGAYFIGKSFGKRKLWPKISPNKTIGGAVGGLVMAILVGCLFQLVYPFPDSFLFIIGISAVISIVGQLGDLVASAIKRHYNVKDSGKLFPGHGGILDRLDSLLFVLIVLHIIQFV